MLLVLFLKLRRILFFYLFFANLLKADSFKGYYHVANEFGVVFQSTSFVIKDIIIIWNNPLEGCFRPILMVP